VHESCLKIIGRMLADVPHSADGECPAGRRGHRGALGGVMELQVGEERITGLRDGVAVGWVDFEVTDGVARLFHTEVLPTMRNTGAGTDLVVSVLEWFRDNTEYRIVGVCPFIPVVIRRHPEFEALTTR